MTSQGHTSPHQPERLPLLCSALLCSYTTEETQGSLSGHHLGDSLHAVNPNVNSWRRLAAERVTTSSGSRRKKKTVREVDEKPGWVVSHSQRGYRAG